MAAEEEVAKLIITADASDVQRAARQAQGAIIDETRQFMLAAKEQSRQKDRERAAQNAAAYQEREALRRQRDGIKATQEQSKATRSLADDLSLAATRFGAVAGGLGILDRSFKEFSNEDKTFRKIAVAANLSVAEIEKFGPIMRELSRTTGKSTTDIAAALDIMRDKSNKSIGDVVNALPELTAAAVGADVDIKKMADLFGSAMAQFKLKPEQALEFFNKLQKAANDFGLNIDELTDGQLPGLMASMRITGYEGMKGWDQLLATLGAVRHKGFDDTTQAVNALQNRMTNLFASLGDKGVGTTEQLINEMKLKVAQGIAPLDFFMQKLAEFESIGGKVEMTFDQRQLTLIRALQAGRLELQTNMTVLENSTGEVEKAFIKMNNGVGAAWDRIVARFNIGLRNIGAGLDWLADRVKKGPVGQIPENFMEKHRKLFPPESLLGKSQKELEELRKGNPLGEENKAPILGNPLFQRQSYEGGRNLIKGLYQLDDTLGETNSLLHRTSYGDTNVGGGNGTNFGSGGSGFGGFGGSSGEGGGVSISPTAPARGAGQRQASLGGGGDIGGGGGAREGTTPSTGYAGGNNFLAQKRAGFAQELQDPQTRKLAGAITSAENPGAGSAVMESLMNRTEMVNEQRAKEGKAPLTLKDMMMGHPSIDRGKSFYGPVRSGAINSHLRKMNDPSYAAKMNANTDAALGGSDRIRGYTDQGSRGDPNYERGGTGVNINGERFNDWGYRGSAAWRQRRQQEMRDAGTPTPGVGIGGEAAREPGAVGPARPGAEWTDNSSPWQRTAGMEAPFRRASMRRELDREMRESRWTSFSDIGAA